MKHVHASPRSMMGLPPGSIDRDLGGLATRGVDIGGFGEPALADPGSIDRDPAYEAGYEGIPRIRRIGDVPSLADVGGVLGGAQGKLKELIGGGMERLDPAARRIAARFPGALSGEAREAMLAELRAGEEFDPDDPDPSRHPQLRPGRDRYGRAANIATGEENLAVAMTPEELEEYERRGQDPRMTERMREELPLDPAAGYSPAEMAILQRSDVYGDINEPLPPGPTEAQLVLRAAEKQRLKGRGDYAEGIRHRRRMAKENLRNAPRFWYNLTGDAKADAAMGVAMANQFGNVLGEQVKGRTAREELLAKGGMLGTLQEQQQRQFDMSLKVKMIESLNTIIASPDTPYAQREAARLRRDQLIDELSRGGTARAAGGDPFSDDSFDFSRGDDPFDRSRGGFGGGAGGSGINAGQAMAELERDNPGMMAQLEGAFVAPDSGDLNTDIGGYGSPADLAENVSGWFKGTVRRTNSDQLSYLSQNLAGLIDSGQITSENIAMVGPIIGAKLHAALRVELGRSEDRLSRGGVDWADIQQFMNDLMAGRMPANYKSLVSPTRIGGIFNRSR